MSTLLVISLLLLGGLLTLRRYEQARGRRFIERTRHVLDETHNSVVATALRVLKTLIEYIHRDILMKSLHLISYLALLFVQWLERKLVQITRFFRSFRRQRKLQDGTDE